MKKKLANKIKTLLLVTSIISVTLPFSVSSVKALEITITENGSGSSSEVSSQVSSTTTIEQVNNSQTSNDVDISSETGGNTVSDNQGEANISTGDASTQVSIDNSSNLSSIDASCCPNEQITLTISGNGEGTVNQIDASQGSETNIFVSQNAQISNEVNGYSNTGKNSADGNMGSVSVDTGDIKVSGSITNFTNVTSVKVGSGVGSLSIKVGSNGSDSENNASAYASSQTNVFIDQQSEFKNTTDWYLETGENSAEANIGDVDIKTGDISFEFFIKNLANIGGVETDCCEDILDPGKPPTDGDDETPPVDDGGGGGSSNDGGGGGGSQGSILPSAAATEAGGPGIIGLSDTSSEGAKALFFWVSLAFVAFGGKIITEELLPKTSKKKI